VLLGHPVRHSLSPVLQNAALRAAGVPLTYEALDVAPDELLTALRTLAESWAAGNVTIPHKESVAELCTRRTPLADRVGAVNTFWFEDDGALVGDNTDVGGFDFLTRHVLGAIPSGVHVAVLGAGGGAAAVLTAISEWPDARVTLCSRTAERRERLAARHPVVTHTTSDSIDAVQDCAILVNTTPVGLTDDTMPLRVSALGPGTAVLDLVYRPGETALVRAARERGLLAGDGLRMLVEQGALAFERWLGQPAPRAAMWSAVCENS
jgi:shikimate dehydrogenase